MIQTKYLDPLSFKLCDMIMHKMKIKSEMRLPMLSHSQVKG